MSVAVNLKKHTVSISHHSMQRNHSILLTEVLGKAMTTKGLTANVNKNIKQNLY